ASRSWNKIFDEEIKKFGFAQNLDKPYVYQKASGSNVTFLILYVDDIIIMGNHIPCLQSVKDYLGKCFAMKDLGEADFILGIKIYEDRSKRLIGLGQNAYMDKILKRYRMNNSKRGHIPMQERLDLNKTQGASTTEKVKCMQNVPCASPVGSIMYVVRCTIPDVAFAQNITIRFQQNPAELRVNCYRDAGFETDRDDIKSQTRYESEYSLSKAAMEVSAVHFANEPGGVSESARDTIKDDIILFARAIYRTKVCTKVVCAGAIYLAKEIEDYLYQKKLHEPLAEAKPTGMKAEDWAC
ncbi:retrotransposon protein, putative, ty1-copia subclass, partial [Tanacetum coccineum]